MSGRRRNVKTKSKTCLRRNWITANVGIANISYSHKRTYANWWKAQQRSGRATDRENCCCRHFIIFYSHCRYYTSSIHFSHSLFSVIIVCCSTLLSPLLNLFWCWKCATNSICFANIHSTNLAYNNFHVKKHAVDIIIIIIVDVVGFFHFLPMPKFSQVARQLSILRGGISSS